MGSGPGSAGDDDRTREVSARSRPEAPGTEPTDLSRILATSESGVAIIYGALDCLVEEFDLEDAFVVLDAPGAGRQVFRAGRRPIATDDEAMLHAPTGIYTQPQLAGNAFDANLLLSSCLLALRLDWIRYDAGHDPLTGLDGRRSFDRLLDMAVARSNRYGWPFTLVLVDLDDFKVLNDTFGHQAGDDALRDLGERFRRALRFGDNAARIGGDEFAMVLPDTEPELVPVLLERVRTAPGLESPCPEFSFGTAICPTEADDAAALFALADQRLYAAKAERRR
ncbi:MAG TPA: GGDEF domain-containing protein [Acidimicrobiia bacterium]|nr:GGDEF domain-containing protein [Acidimicrobiia bacterium]